MSTEQIRLLKISFATICFVIASIFGVTCITSDIDTTADTAQTSQVVDKTTATLDSTCQDDSGTAQPAVSPAVEQTTEMTPAG